MNNIKNYYILSILGPFFLNFPKTKITKTHRTNKYMMMMMKVYNHNNSMLNQNPNQILPHHLNHQNVFSSVPLLQKLNSFSLPF